MTTAALPTRDRAGLLRRGLRLEYLTVGWNLVEGLIAIGAGLAAGSVALIGFGIDSFVESGSGSVLIWRLRAETTGRADEEHLEHVERRAERFVGLSFLLLGAYVAYEAVQTLIAQEQPTASPVGIALTLLSLAVMLWLARAKRRTDERWAVGPSSPTASRPLPAGTCRQPRLRAWA